MKILQNLHSSYKNHFPSVTQALKTNVSKITTLATNAINRVAPKATARRFCLDKGVEILKCTVITVSAAGIFFAAIYGIGKIAAPITVPIGHAFSLRSSHSDSGISEGSDAFAGAFVLTIGMGYAFVCCAGVLKCISYYKNWRSEQFEIIEKEKDLEKAVAERES